MPFVGAISHGQWKKYIKHHFLRKGYINVHIYQLFKPTSFSRNTSLAPQHQRFWFIRTRDTGLSPLLGIREGCLSNRTTLHNHLKQQNSSKHPRWKKDDFLSVNSYFTIDFNYAAHWSMQSSLASCCCLQKKAEPKLHVPMIPTTKLSQLCKMFRLPEQVLALSHFAYSARLAGVLSSASSFCHATCEEPFALWSHVTFSRARNFSECKPTLNVPICLFQSRSWHVLPYALLRYQWNSSFLPDLRFFTVSKFPFHILQNYLHGKA